MEATVIDYYNMYHCHSDYSLLDSCTKFEDYIELSIRDGAKAIASTEHGKPIGNIENGLACNASGIKFIYGVEAYLTETLEEKVRDNYHTVLLARNQKGIEEINYAISKSCQQDHFYYVNRITFDEFLGLSDNVITTSACIASPLSKLPHDHPLYEDLIKKYTFLEVQPHVCEIQAEYNRWLLELSKKYNKPLIVGTDTHSSSRYKAECRSILMAAKHKHFDNEDQFDLSYKTVDELRDMFATQGVLTQNEYNEAIRNTHLLEELCDDYRVDTTIKYPILYGTPEKDEEIYTDLVHTLLEEKITNGVIPEEQADAFKSAVEEELEVFHKIGMNGFMLSMSELIRWCKNSGIVVGPGRGSVGGSRCAYVTDITDTNPERWHTVFSRFANEDRQEIGDIDIDITEADRPKVFEYIRGRFGEDKTARVAAFGTLVDKSVIEEIVRGMFFKKHPEEKKPNKETVELYNKIKAEFIENKELARNKYKDVFYYFDGLVGTKVSQSVHPAGMVISPITLADNYGVFDKDGESCLFCTMDEAHEVGLAKYDFLILRNIGIINDTCKYAGIPYPKAHEIDFDDENVWKDMLRSPVGIFQMEGEFAFSLLKKYRCKNLFDMSLVTACIRPSGASYRDNLINRVQHHNPSKLIDDLLADNNGYLVYQEDTIKFLQQICGLTGSEADNVRRAIGRKQRDRLEKALPKILDGYCSRSDQPRDVAENEAREFLQILEDSADYQFGYNHSIEYCIVGYYCAYLRYYYPIEFITALLNNAANDSDIANGTDLAGRYGIKITNPKWGVSRSEYFFNKDENTIAKGLASMKYMGAAVADELYELSTRKTYDSFVDLLYDINKETTLDSRQLSNLIKIDYFSMFGNQRELLRIVDFMERFKFGEAKKIKCDEVNGTQIEAIVRNFSTCQNKNGSPAKSYTILDVMAILREIEKMILDIHMDDLGDIVKVKNFEEIMGFAGYVSGNSSDRRKLYIKAVFPLKNRTTGEQFGYSIITKSIGSGKEARFTVRNSVFKKSPIKKGDVIYCEDYYKNGIYFTMTKFHKILA